MKNTVNANQKQLDNSFHSYRKVIIIEVKGVGKKTLINNLSDNMNFNESFTYSSEIITTTRFSCKLTHEKKMSLNIVNIELDDSNIIQSLSDSLLLNCSLVLAVTDISTKNALSSLLKIIPMMSNMQMILVVNKINRQESIIVNDKDIANFKEANPSIEVFELAKMNKENTIQLFNRMYDLVNTKVNKVYQTVGYKDNCNESLDGLTMKVCLLGDSTVGKTAMMRRFFNNYFHEGMTSTIGMDVQKINIEVNASPFRFEVWDTAGQNQLRRIPVKHYSKVDGFIIIFDVTNRESFLDVKGWIADIKQEAQPNVLIYLIGNKIDRVQGREVTKEEAKNLAIELRVNYSEISCKYGLNIMEVMTNLIVDVYKKIENVNSSIILLPEYHKKKKKNNQNKDEEGCC